jgi:hypothetical protein
MLRVAMCQKPGWSWQGFAKKLGRLLCDAIPLGTHSARSAPGYTSKRQRIHARLQELQDFARPRGKTSMLGG